MIGDGWRRGRAARDAGTAGTGRTPILIAGYEVLTVIGVDAIATVYEVVDRANGAVVALKRFEGTRFDHLDGHDAHPPAAAPTHRSRRTTALDHPAFDRHEVERQRFDRQRFEREVRATRLVSGRPHLTALIDAGIDDGHPYVVTPLYRRGTLFDAVAHGGPLSAGELAGLGRQLTYALETLHRNGVVHADVAPQHVFIGDDNSWALGDLGSAWSRTGAGGATTRTSPCAAPEIWLGGAPTAAADIYALGATLLFAATGRVPFAGTPPDHGMVAALLGDAAALLAADPARRPASAAHAARAFWSGDDSHDPWTAQLTSDRRGGREPRCGERPDRVSPAEWRGAATGRRA